LSFHRLDSQNIMEREMTTGDFMERLESDRERAKKFLRLTPELSKSIQGRIDAAKAEGARAAWPDGACLARDSLLLYNTPYFCWGLKSDGVLLAGDFDRFAMEPETDLRAIYALVHYGARRYPEFVQLLPPPPEGLEACKVCGGAGSLAGASNDAGRCASCDVVGWSVPGVNRLL
jgi:hypothetical protein